MTTLWNRHCHRSATSDPKIPRDCLPKVIIHSGHRKHIQLKICSLHVCHEFGGLIHIDALCLQMHILSAHISMCFSYIHIYFSQICTLLKYSGIYSRYLGICIYSHLRCSFTLPSHLGAHALNTNPAHSYSRIISQVLSMQAYYAYIANILLIVFGLTLY